MQRSTLYMCRCLIVHSTIDRCYPNLNCVIIHIKMYFISFLWFQLQDGQIQLQNQEQALAAEIVLQLHADSSFTIQ